MPFHQFFFVLEIKKVEYKYVWWYREMITISFKRLINKY